MKTSRTIMSSHELSSVLLEHARNPSRLSYWELPDLIGRSFWESLPEAERAYYEPDELSPNGVTYLTYRAVRSEAWVVEVPR